MSEETSLQILEQIKGIHGLLSLAFSLGCGIMIATFAEKIIPLWRKDD